MLDKLASLNITQIPGFRRKKSTIDKKYATFNRRIIAITIDTLILALLVSQPISLLVARYYQMTPDLNALLMQMQGAPTPHQALIAFWEGFVQSGALNVLLVNNVLQTLVMLVLTGICWHFWSATPGKMLMRIRVAAAVTEAPVSTRQILLRLAGYLLDAFTLCVGMFWVGIDKRRQSWHDKMAGTVVLVVPWRRVTPGSEAADRSGSPEPSAPE